jgi:hypothetical protein
MVLCSKTGSELFTEQKKIMQFLNKFCRRFKCHILLIVHPNKGGLEISGATEIQNLADTIIRYMRITPQELEGKCELPEPARNTISAVLMNDKVREGGSNDPCYLKWDATIGGVVELTKKQKANEKMFLWSEYVSSYGDSDLPDYEKQYNFK